MQPSFALCEPRQSLAPLHMHQTERAAANGNVEENRNAEALQPSLASLHLHQPEQAAGNANTEALPALSNHRMAMVREVR